MTRILKELQVECVVCRSCEVASVVVLLVKQEILCRIS